MAGHGTIIGKLADAIGRERECGAAALHDDTVGARSILVDDHVVLGALTVDQVDLHELAFMHDELRIDPAVDVAADAEKDHASFGDARAQREYSRAMWVTSLHSG